MKNIKGFNAARLGRARSFIAAWKVYRHTFLKVITDQERKKRTSDLEVSVTTLLKAFQIQAVSGQE